LELKWVTISPNCRGHVWGENRDFSRGEKVVAPKKDEAVAFLARLEKLLSGPTRLDEVRALVREDPELAVAAAYAYLAAGERRHLQMAGALAVAYDAELEDDGLASLKRLLMSSLPWVQESKFRP
jgi:hypothetical protein